jgi:hypothetical protein
LSIIAATLLLSPVLGFLMAIAAEILVGFLVSAGALVLPAFIAAGAIGWVLLRRLWRGRGGAPIET